MNITESLRDIVSLEEEYNPDWGIIYGKCISILDYIHKRKIVGDISSTIYEFLDDVDIRSKDYDYGRRQRDRLKKELGLG